MDPYHRDWLRILLWLMNVQMFQCAHPCATHLVGLPNHYIVLLLHHGSTNLTTNIVVNCWDFHLHLVCMYIHPPGLHIYWSSHLQLPPRVPKCVCVFMLKCTCMWRPERDVERFFFSFCIILPSSLRRDPSLTPKLAVSTRQAPPLVLGLQP